MLTINLLKVADSAALIHATADASTVRGIHEIGMQVLKGGTSQGQGPALADAGAAGLTLSTEERRDRQPRRRHVQGAVLHVPRR